MAQATPTPLGPGALRAALELTMEEERIAATAATMSLRRGASFAFLVALVVLWSTTHNEGWRVCLLPMALHAGFAGLAYMVRHRSIALRLAPAAAVLDVALVLMTQLYSLPYSPMPAGVAGFSLGLFAMVVVLNGLTLRPDVVITATVSAIFAELVLMEAVEIPRGPMVIAALVLGVVAVAGHELTRRMHGIVARFALAEISREIESRHSAEVEEARRTIEGLLVESRGQNERLERLQRDKEGLTQLLVHDLRSPITVIVGYVDLVRMYLDEMSAPPSYVRALDQVLGTATRLTAMINDLLQIAKLEDGRLALARSSLDARRLLDDLADEARGLVQGRSVGIETTLVGDGALEADASLLRRVLENLVSNAARYTPTGQRIHLATELHAAETVLVVENDGPAIDAALRDRVFDKYQQGDNARTGWGLGLYFCRLAVEAHGGTIRVEEREGYGTSFVIRLPRPVLLAEPPHGKAA